MRAHTRQQTYLVTLVPSSPGDVLKDRRKMGHSSVDAEATPF
jgi:hypothetical protein